MIPENTAQNPTAKPISMCHYVLSPAHTIKSTAPIPTAFEITSRSQHLNIFFLQTGGKYEQTRVIDYGYVFG